MDILYEIRKLARQLCCYRANPLQYFDESAGATLTKKGVTDGARLVLTDNSTYLGDPTGAASGFYSTVGGGEGNTASDAYATVGGGEGNTASGDNSTVAGGSSNQATAQSATVGGGDSNVATGYGATVPGGSVNFAEGDFSVALGSAAHARHQGEFAQANNGGQAGKILSASTQTTNATPAQVTLDGVSAMIVPTDNEVWSFRARIVAKAPAVSKAWVTDLEFAVTNFGGTLTQLGTTDTGFDKKTGSTTWTAAVYVSGDNVSVTVTGAVGETVTWFVDFWYTKR